MPELSILMPCLNEARTLPVCILRAKRFLKDYRVDGEIIVSDNGSLDGSAFMAIDLGAKVVTTGPKGYGAALLAGIKAARGQYIIMGDADDSYDFQEIIYLLSLLRAGNDVVIGNRFGNIKRRAMPWMNWIGNKVLTFVGNRLYKTNLHDWHCGLRGINRESFGYINPSSTGMEFASEMIILAKKAGLKIVDVPVSLWPDGRGRGPHLRPLRDGIRHLSLMIKMR